MHKDYSEKSVQQEKTQDDDSMMQEDFFSEETSGINEIPFLNRERFLTYEEIVRILKERNI